VTLLPNQSHPINPGGKTDADWTRWFQKVERALSDNGKPLSELISAIATALGSPDGTVANIPPLSESQVTILQGAGIKVTGNAHDGYQIALQPISDSGTGTFKLIERDEYGRVSGSVDGGAADIPYDPTASGLTATDVQAAVDELAARPASSGVPYFIASGDTFSVPEFQQALFAMSIDCEGILAVDGYLIGVD
jgi:hypothetical protein